jgi:type VI secretion system secreted protein VgrG
VLIPDDAPFRPERRTAGPRVEGPETAVVVGEGEIDCDEHGRILCRFHWDLDGAHTMRVRVSQNWASQGWGGIVIPRIGMEVIVEHLRGDPDKPIVTGCVYNGRNKPPYELPKHKTRSTFRTDSHQSNYNGFNEFRFEDQTRSEEVFLRAQKDLNIKTKHNRTSQTDRNNLESIARTSLRRVGDDEMVSIGGGYSIEVSANPAARNTSEKAQATFDGLSDLYGAFREALQSPGTGNMLVDVEGNLSVKAGQNRALNVLGAENRSIKGVSSQVANGGFQINTPRKFSVDANSTLLNSAKTLTLTVGSAKITLRSDGTATIYAEKLALKTRGTMDLEAKGNMNLTSNGDMKLTAHGEVSVRGSRIDLN